MEKYFITKGIEKKGPYSIDELSKMELTDEYLVWKGGFENWKSITEIEELKNNIIISPPPTPVQLKRTFQKMVFIESLQTSWIWLLIFWASIYWVMGGTKSAYALKDIYGYGEYAIFGGGEVIRQALIWTSLFISFIFFLVIVYFVYRRNIKPKTTRSNRDSQKDEQISPKHV